MQCILRVYQYAGYGCKNNEAPAYTVACCSVLYIAESTIDSKLQSLGGKPTENKWKMCTSRARL